MKYKIYRLVEPEVLKYIDESGWENSIKNRIAFEEVLWNEFDTEQEAKDYISENKEQFSRWSYTIILTF